MRRLPPTNCSIPNGLQKFTIDTGHKCAAPFSDMKLFPHWLDGEYVNISGGFDQRGIADCCDYLRTILKLHALLGTEFVLNDVQIYDSWAVVALFRDDAAYKFLLEDQSFLELRVPAKTSASAGLSSVISPRSPFELAISGLDKPENPNWTSSLFRSDSSPIRSLAKEIRESQDLDPERPSMTVRNFPNYARELNAIRRAIHYFSSLGRTVREMNPVQSDYFSVLEQLRERVVGEDQRLIETTFAFLERPEVKGLTASRRRSDVLRILHQAPAENQRTIWNNVVLAWIQATQNTIAPNGGSVGGLPDAVTPAIYLDKLVDTIDPPDYTPASALSTQVPVDISSLSWEEIAKARIETQETQMALEKVRFTGVAEVVRPKLAEHAKALAKVLVVPSATKIPGWVYQIADYASVYFGLENHPWVNTGIKIGKEALKAADSGLTSLSTRLRRRSFADVIVKTAMPIGRK